MLSTSEPIRVLHVDDEPTFLDRENDQFSVETAPSADRGLELIGDRPPDCVVSDYNMPGMDGIEFLRAVREEHPDLPFILFTGKGSEAVASEAISAGVTDYLQKGSGTERYELLTNRIRNAVQGRREAQRDLRQSETLFQQSQEALFLVSVGDEFTVERVNPAWEEKTGLSAERVRGQTPRELLGDRQGADVEARYRECVERREPLEYTEQLEFGEERRHYETKIAPVLSEGTVEYVVGSSRDVTDRRERQRDLRVLRQAIDDANVAITLSDPQQEDNPLVYVNDAFEEATGYGAEESLGRNCRFLQGERTDPEKTATLREAIDEEEPVTVELRNYHKDGTEFWNRVTITPVSSDGGLVRFLGTQEDITERKEREEALEQLHGSTRTLMRTASPEEVATTGAETAAQVLDLQVSVVFRSDPAEDELVPVGWSDETEAVLDSPPPTLPIDGSLAGRSYRTGEPETYADVREADEIHNPETDFRSELHIPIGDYGVLVSGSTTVDDFDASDRALAQILSTNLKTALDRVERTQELERQNERLEEFTSVVSHDLRSPLNTADLGIELAQAEFVSPHLDEARRGIDRSFALIEDLLTLARDGEQIGSTEPVALAEAVTDAWETVGTAEATLSLETETTVHADRSRLRQLLINLVENAVDHGGPDVVVTVEGTEAGFAVEDDGTGVPAGDRETVFDAGYSTAESGTGFGLRIVSQVASGHGWDVSVTDGEDGGARFEITGVTTEADTGRQKP